nr:hypothetical protein CFP56_46653 [Quercus suber]
MDPLKDWTRKTADTNVRLTLTNHSIIDAPLSPRKLPRSAYHHCSSINKDFQGKITNTTSTNHLCKIHSFSISLSVTSTAENMQRTSKLSELSESEWSIVLIEGAVLLARRNGINDTHLINDRSELGAKALDGLLLQNLA